MELAISFTSLEKGMVLNYFFLSVHTAPLTICTELALGSLFQDTEFTFLNAIF
jgi:hypothetical protein